MSDWCLVILLFSLSLPLLSLTDWCLVICDFPSHYYNHSQTNIISSLLSLSLTDWCLVICGNRIHSWHRTGDLFYFDKRNWTSWSLACVGHCRYGVVTLYVLIDLLIYYLIWFNLTENNLILLYSGVKQLFCFHIYFISFLFL